MGISAAYAAFDYNGVCRAVALTCPAFHASFRPNELGQALILNENQVWTDNAAHPAAAAQIRIISERVRDIGAFHHPAPKRRRRIVITRHSMPPPNIQAITGI